MKNSRQVALGGLLTAMAVAIMLLTNLFPYAQISLPALASFCIAIALIELGVHVSIIVYVASAILIAIITPNIEAKIFYIALFGYYPVIKYFIQKIRIIALQWVIKMVYCNYGLAMLYFVAANFIEIPSWLVNYSWIVLVLVFNFVFVIFDIGYSKLIDFYCMRIHPHLPNAKKK